MLYPDSFSDAPGNEGCNKGALIFDSLLEYDKDDVRLFIDSRSSTAGAPGSLCSFASVNDAKGGSVMRWGDSGRNASKAPVLRATSMLLIVDLGTFEHIVSDFSLGNVLRRLSEISLDPITHSMREMHHN